jgi:hypothetical protein
MDYILNFMHLSSAAADNSLLSVKLFFSSSAKHRGKIPPSDVRHVATIAVEEWERPHVFQRVSQSVESNDPHNKKRRCRRPYRCR